MYFDFLCLAVKLRGIWLAIQNVIALLSDRYLPLSFAVLECFCGISFIGKGGKLVDKDRVREERHRGNRKWDLKIKHKSATQKLTELPKIIFSQIKNSTTRSAAEEVHFIKNRNGFSFCVLFL
jgi:hypothetical protein